MREGRMFSSEHCGTLAWRLHWNEGVGIGEMFVIYRSGYSLKSFLSSH